MDDRIVFDYGGDPIVTETANVMDYIGAMVGSVREKAGQMGLAAQFVFKMSRCLWEGICDLYACIVPARSEIPRLRAELRAEQAIFVDGVRFPVELDEAAGDSIWFVPQGEDFGGRPSVAVLRNVGVNE